MTLVRTGSCAVALLCVWAAAHAQTPPLPPPQKPGERRPGTAISGKSSSMTKEQLTTALEGALGYCDPAYQEPSDATVLATVKQASPMTNELSRASALVGNIAHHNEHYGNIATYLRIKGILPPTERARQPR
jgi:hypothetical protein